MRLSLTYLLFGFLSFFFKANGQENLGALKIEYQHGCSFCASYRFTAKLFLFDEEVFYTYKHDPRASAPAEGHSVIIDTTTLHIRYDLKSDSIYQLGAMRSINPNGILIAEKRNPIDWLLKDSVKVIEGRFCKLAVGDFRGRQYYAWYDPNVKINFGPWKLHGLPGALIYAEDTTQELYFKAIQITELKGVKSEEFVRKPALPIVDRLIFRAKREEVYERILNLKPEDESKYTYHITLKKNYFEFE